MMGKRRVRKNAAQRDGGNAALPENTCYNGVRLRFQSNIKMKNAHVILSDVTQTHCDLIPLYQRCLLMKKKIVSGLKSMESQIQFASADTGARSICDSHQNKKKKKWKRIKNNIIPTELPDLLGNNIKTVNPTDVPNIIKTIMSKEPKIIASRIIINKNGGSINKMEDTVDTNKLQNSHSFNSSPKESRKNDFIDLTDSFKIPNNMCSILPKENKMDENKRPLKRCKYDSKKSYPTFNKGGELVQKVEKIPVKISVPISATSKVGNRCINFMFKHINDLSIKDYVKRDRESSVTDQNVKSDEVNKFTSRSDNVKQDSCITENNTVLFDEVASHVDETKQTTNVERQNISCITVNTSKANIKDTSEQTEILHFEAPTVTESNVSHVEQCKKAGDAFPAIGERLNEDTTKHLGTDQSSGKTRKRSWLNRNRNEVCDVRNQNKIRLHRKPALMQRAEKSDELKDCKTERSNNDTVDLICQEINNNTKNIPNTCCVINETRDEVDTDTSITKLNINNDKSTLIEEQKINVSRISPIRYVVRDNNERLQCDNRRKDSGSLETFTYCKNEVKVDDKKQNNYHNDHQSGDVNNSNSDDDDGDVMSLYAESISNILGTSIEDVNYSNESKSSDVDNLVSTNFSAYVASNNSAFEKEYEAFRTESNIENLEAVNKETFNSTKKRIPYSTKNIFVKSKVETVKSNDNVSPANITEYENKSLTNVRNFGRYPTEFFRDYCFSTLKKGQCDRVNDCHYKHTIDEQIKQIYKWESQETILERMKVAVSKNYIFYTRKLYTVVLKKIHVVPTINLFKLLYNGKFVNFDIVWKTTHHLLQKFKMPMRAFLSCIKRILQPDDDQTRSYVIQSIKEFILPGEYWDTLKDFILIHQLSVFNVEKILHECITIKKDIFHAQEINENLIVKLKPNILQHIRKSLMSAFYSLLNISAVYPNCNQVQAVDERIINLLDPVRTSDFTVSNGLNFNQRHMLKDIQEIINQHPEYQWENRISELYTDLHQLQEGLKFKDYNNIINILDKKRNEGMLIHRCYKILRMEIKQFPIHLTEIIKRSGERHFTKKDA